jgi:hydrogenase expression/formation protein HypE
MYEKILLAHGSGGRLTHELIKNTFLKKLKNGYLNELSDAAVIDYQEKLAFTTDSFVVNPLFFPGGDIGKLAVCGTVNDLVMLGAKPQYLSCGLIIEEGLEQRILEKIIDSLSFYARKSNVRIVTGDTKVVEKGAADKIFINTSGIGEIISKRRFSVDNIEEGDKIVITGNIAEHGLSVLAKRKELDLGFNIKSDCNALDKLLLPLLKSCAEIKFMRDPTRGGVATTLNEIAQSRGVGIVVEEKNIPLSSRVRAASELLGIDPMYVANEGKALLVVKAKAADKIVRYLRRFIDGRNAAIIAEVTKQPRGRVILRTVFKTERIIDMLTSEPLPRIC